MQLRHKRAQKDNDTITAEALKEELPEMEIASAELTVVDLGDEPKLECKQKQNALCAPKI